MIVFVFKHIVGKSWLWEKIKVFFIKAPHSLGILLHKQKFIRTDFIIFEFTRAYNAFISVCRSYDNIYLRLFLGFWIAAPLLPDFRHIKRQQVVIIQNVISAHFFKYDSHIIRQSFGNNLIIRLLDSSRNNSRWVNCRNHLAWRNTQYRYRRKSYILLSIVQAQSLPF